MACLMMAIRIYNKEYNTNVEMVSSQQQQDNSINNNPFNIICSNKPHAIKKSSKR